MITQEKKSLKERSRWEIVGIKFFVEFPAMESKIISKFLLLSFFKLKNFEHRANLEWRDCLHDYISDLTMKNLYGNELFT